MAVASSFREDTDAFSHWQRLNLKRNAYSNPTTMTAATQRPELSNEQLTDLKNRLRAIEKDFGLSASEVFYQAAAYSFNNYLDLVSAAAKHQTGISDYKDEALKAKVAEISTACGLASDTKRNIVSAKDITDASVQLWKAHGDDIRAFFASKKK